MLCPSPFGNRCLDLLTSSPAPFPSRALQASQTSRRLRSEFTWLPSLWGLVPVPIACGGGRGKLRLGRVPRELEVTRSELLLSNRRVKFTP